MADVHADAEAGRIDVALRSARPAPTASTARWESLRSPAARRSGRATGDSSSRLRTQRRRGGCRRARRTASGTPQCTHQDAVRHDRGDVERRPAFRRPPPCGAPRRPRPGSGRPSTMPLTYALGDRRVHRVQLQPRVVEPLGRARPRRGDRGSRSASRSGEQLDRVEAVRRDLDEVIAVEPVADGRDAWRLPNGRVTITACRGFYAQLIDHGIEQARAGVRSAGTLARFACT